MARDAHGYGLSAFGDLVAHATGTRTNSSTDLTTFHEGRRSLAESTEWSGRLPMITAGVPKTVGDGHSMGGLKVASEALHYLLGQKTVGVPTLLRPDPDLGAAADATQRFGGFDAAGPCAAPTPRRCADTNTPIGGYWMRTWNAGRRSAAIASSARRAGGGCGGVPESWPRLTAEPLPDEAQS